MLSVTQMLQENATLSDDEARLRQAMECSPFLQRMLSSKVHLTSYLLQTMHQSWTAQTMRDWLSLQEVSDEATLKRALRKLRQLVIARIIVRDLNGLADLFEVMQTMSHLAEVAVQFALLYLQQWLEAQYGEPIGESGSKQTLIVVGMGKLGGAELNVSSDIDLIFAFKEDGETRHAESVDQTPQTVTDKRPVLGNVEFFSRLCKKLIAAIDEITEDGFVFRVDMRLRPYGSEGPLACSFAMLEDYYQNLGREWERYAWIKGRVIAGPEKELAHMLRPFVFRKYLDFGAFASMRDLKAQIMSDVARREMQDNIKLGSGGIREIEFIAQVFQLIRGGRDQALQIRPTLNVLQCLAEKGLLPVTAVKELSAAYIFLRNLEHRLQYLHDAQTHELPKDQQNRLQICQAMDQPDWSSMLALISETRAIVSSHFQQVFAPTQQSPEIEDIWMDMWKGRLNEAQVLDHLKQHGYADPGEVLRQIIALRESSRFQSLPLQSRERFDALMPEVLRISGTRFNANQTLLRMIALLESICRRASYLAFFVEYPQVLERVARLLSASPWMASYLSQHPILLDELLATHESTEPDFARDGLKLQALMDSLSGDTEAQMDATRHFQQARLFHFATEDIVNRLPLERLSSWLSNLADMFLACILKTVWPTIRGVHRESPKFAIIAYGKLGGRELGYSSDLDMVFLYDDDHPDAGEVYRRLGLKLISWLNTMTPAGVLYETDMQLRPDGGSGLLVCSLTAFDKYQHEKAWTWEHQAITRARFCAGDAALGAAFERIRKDIIARPRDLNQLREDVIAMRTRMNDSHTYQKGRFDLKHDLGGMIDVEFIVQYLVLAYAHQNRRLCENRANIHILRLCSALGLIPHAMGEAAADAYKTLRREQHASRLQGYADAWVPEELVFKEVIAIRALWKAVFYEQPD